MSRGRRRDQLDFSESGLRDVAVMVDFAGVSATRGSDNKDIHYARRGFFPGRNERSVCFAVSPCLFPRCFCVCMCLLSASAIRSSFRRASGICDLRALTISPGKAIKIQSTKGTRSREDNDRILDEIGFPIVNVYVF